MNEVPTLVEFLKTLSGPPGWAILGTFFSIAFSKWKWFESQESLVKNAIVIASSFVVSALSLVMLNYLPPDIMKSIAPYFIILYGTIATYTGGQLMHRIGKIADNGKS